MKGLTPKRIKDELLKCHGIFAFVFYQSVLGKLSLIATGHQRYVLVIDEPKW